MWLTDVNNSGSDVGLQNLKNQNQIMLWKLLSADWKWLSHNLQLW